MVGMISRRALATPLLAGLIALFSFACDGNAVPTPTPQDTRPAPTATVEAPLTNRQILLRDRSSLPAYAYNEFDNLLAEVEADDPITPENDGVITDEEVGKVHDVIGDSRFLTVAQHDGLTAEWKLKNYSSAYAELKDRSYSPYLLVNLGNLTLALNAKVLVEDMYNDETDIREMNGGYIFALHRDGRMLLPPSLDDTILKRLYPDETKRRAMLMNFWFVQDWRPGNTVEYQAKRANLASRQNNDQAVERAYNDPTFNITGPSSGNMVRMSEHEWAEAAWGDWQKDRARNGWSNTVAVFEGVDRILSSDPQFGETWEKVKFRLGYARVSHLPNWSVDLYFGHESNMRSMLPATYGGLIPITHACSAPVDNLQVCEFVIGGIPQYLLDRINSELGQYELADLGYGISLYLPRKAMEMDGARRLVYWEPSFGRDGLITRDKVVWNAEVRGN